MQVVATLLRTPVRSRELYTLSPGPADRFGPPPEWNGAVDVPRIRHILACVLRAARPLVSFLPHALACCLALVRKCTSLAHTRTSLCTLMPLCLCVLAWAYACPDPCFCWCARAARSNNWFGGPEHTEADIFVRLQRWQHHSGQWLPAAERARQLKAIEERHLEYSGLWVRPSLFNHSCRPNCQYSAAGAFLFVTTTRAVAAGEELCVPYTTPLDPFSARSSTLATFNQDHGFVCRCERCEAVRAHPAAAALEDEASALLERAAQLSGSLPMAAAADAAGPPQRRRALLAQLEQLPLAAAAGALMPLLELEAGAAADAGRAAAAVRLYERLVSVRRWVLGDVFISCPLLRDNLGLAAAASLAGRAATAQQAMAAAFALGCLCRWERGLPVRSFETLVERYVVGRWESAEQRRAALMPLVAAAHAASGRRVAVEEEPSCVHCLGAMATRLACSRCGALYCSREHQREHWPLHRHLCRGTSAVDQA